MHHWRSVYGNSTARVVPETGLNQPKTGEACLATASGLDWIWLDLVFNFNYLKIWRRGRDSNPGYSF
jgi:hypothetical protein